MIKINGLTKSYRKKRVVDELSFEIKEGELFALLGSNGAGKSTTIKMILGLVKKDAGEIVLPEGKKIGYSPETPHFPPFLTGEEVLRYYGELQGIAKKEWKGTCERLLGRLEMLELIRGFKEQGKTIIMNSHILNDIEKVCDGGIIMKKGKKVNAFKKSDLTKERTLEELFVESVGGTLGERGEAVCG